MKNKIIIGISVLIVAGLGLGLFFFLNNDKEEIDNDVKTETITVKFDSNGGSKVNDVVIKKGEVLILPENPTKEGHTFVRWEDKHATPIYNEALIDGDIALTAVWEKEESVASTEPSNVKPEPKAEPKSVSYKCEEGFKLSGTKCTKIVLPTSGCQSGYTEINSTTCAKIATAVRVESTKVCPKRTVIVPNGHTIEVQGILDKVGYYTCFYGEVTDSYENNSTNCNARSHSWNDNKKKCYYESHTDYTTSCAAGYTYIEKTSEYGINGVNGGCFPSVSKTSCPAGYKMSTLSNKRLKVCIMEKAAMVVE